MSKTALYEWDTRLASTSTLSKTLNEIEVETDWEVFTVFHRSSQTSWMSGAYIVIRRLLENPPQNKEGNNDEEPE